MDFREACNILGHQISTADIAAELKASPYTVRQARLLEGSAGYRNPPTAWERVFVRMARERMKELKKLADQLDRGPGR